MASGFRSGFRSGFGFGNRKSRGYRKYRPLPGLIVIGVLGLVALVVWVRAITTNDNVDAQIRCAPAPTPALGTVYTPLAHTALDDAAPLPPSEIAVTVLNASQGRGEAAITTESLRGLGFTQIAAPDNDPAYPQGDAQCQGQIRFGDAGTSAARTLSLVMPCAELVKDNRPDATVDLSLGNGFQQLQPNAQARQVLQQLNDWAARHSGDGSEGSPATSPVIDPALLAAAHNVAC
ncbi:MAG TPA: envelope integrity protein Cei [Amycolatopsis sp.]|nr:envelope integrity protein Cei [Amycolatopsis sp.]